MNFRLFPVCRRTLAEYPTCKRHTSILIEGFGSDAKCGLPDKHVHSSALASHRRYFEERWIGSHDAKQLLSEVGTRKKLSYPVRIHVFRSYLNNVRARNHLPVPLKAPRIRKIKKLSRISLLFSYPLLRVRVHYAPGKGHKYKRGIFPVITRIYRNKLLEALH